MTSISKSTILLGTRKGLITFKKNESGHWNYSKTQFPGIPVTIATYDFETDTHWALLDHGHWGCKLHRSKDGKSWTELEAPKYPEGELIKEGIPAATKLLWAFSNGGKDNAGTIYIGTEPGGLFKSTDNGVTFELNRALWDQPSRQGQWFGGGRDHPAIHSVVVDPRNSDHVYVGISCAGVFETKDGGGSWLPKNKGLWGDFLPDKYAEIGQDPHLVEVCRAHPDVMWQQNHCGIFRTDNGGEEWQDISQKDGPAVFGFAIAAHESNPNVAWAIPGVSDEIRIPVDQSLCVCRTDDAGKTWKEFRKGLPQKESFDVIYRHSLDVTGETLAFGTTTGNLYLSNDAGESWEMLSTNLPMIHSVEFC